MKVDLRQTMDPGCKKRSRQVSLGDQSTSSNTSHMDVGSIDGGKPRKVMKMSKTGTSVAETAVKSSSEDEEQAPVLKPHPFYYYVDYSTKTDPDPLVPLTAAGKVPNFPAKMHAILSRQDLQDIVSWMPHGRSWRVHKPREFEVRVIPAFFEHVKFSSFVRQANGWGFHRITVDGRDRNSYYHPMFLRGLPHLCKEMKRPKIAKKQPLSPEHEPDLYQITKLHPVPEKVVDDSQLLTADGDPKARMSVSQTAGAVQIPSSFGNISNSLVPSVTSTTIGSQHSGASKGNDNVSGITPRGLESFHGFQKSIGASEMSSHIASKHQHPQMDPHKLQSLMNAAQQTNGRADVNLQKLSSLASAQKMAFSPSMTVSRQPKDPSGQFSPMAAAAAAAASYNAATITQPTQVSIPPPPPPMSGSAFASGFYAAMQQQQHQQQQQQQLSQYHHHDHHQQQSMQQQFGYWFPTPALSHQQYSQPHMHNGSSPTAAGWQAHFG